MTVTIHPLAGEELFGSIEFYAKNGGKDLARAFLDEFERIVGLIRVYPDIGTPWKKTARRLHFRKFPFSVVYTANGNTITIVAIPHHRRKPGYWKNRL